MSFFWQTGLTSLLLLAACHPFRAAASPPINVKLHASFPSPPYLVELLETAADEQPAVYFPILDRIADGYFDDSTNDEQLYNRFLHLLHSDELITDPESLSSINFALSIRNAAPRVEAHYHYYTNKILPSLGSDDCETWIELAGKQHCSPTLEDGRAVDGIASQDLPFDRTLGPDSAPEVATLYADITSQAFRQFHKTAAKSARDGKSRYRIRHRLAAGPKRDALVMSGYGVELALKRTDYIVIDDRQSGEKGKPVPKADSVDGDLEDLTPLSASQLADLGVKAASFVAGSDSPFDALLKITQDFPKHSSVLAKHDASPEFVEEHNENRATFLPEGYNVMWVNGIQYDPRKMDVFSILDHMRRERRLVQSFRDMGLTSSEAIKLLSHPSIFEANTKSGSQRYDWRDQTEGGDVIIWLNNIEKDRRYNDWPEDLFALLQRTFPGQMPSVRRDIHNAIVPIDFTDPKAARLLVDTIQGIIKRRIPLRWGVVPVSSTAEGEEQAKIIYHLQDSYGLVPVMNYLQKVISSAKRGQLLSPSAGAFAASVNGRNLKEGKTALSFDDLLQNAELHARLEHSQSYLGRLGVRSSPAPMFVNGVAVKQDDDWLQLMSQQVTVDLRTLQQGVFERKFGDADWLPEVFLNQSSLKRNPIVIPENDKDITLLNLPTILRAKKGWADLPRIPIGTATSPAAGFQVILVADFGSPQGSKLAANAIRYRAANERAQLVFVHNPGPSTAESRSQRLFDLLADVDTADLGRISEALDSEATVGSPKPQSWHYPELVASLRFKPGECGVVFNGRKLGPIPAGSDFTEEDFAMLAAYEGSKRHGPAHTALTDLELDSKIASVGDVANLCSVLSLSTLSDIPEGIFEQPPLIRTEIFHHWSDLHTTVSVGDNSTAVIHLVVALDPASETAQRWVPILKAVSQLDGVFVKIYLNPKSVLEELPVKRFYRYVVESAPTFADGRIQGESAEFKGIPSSALLTVGMDVPAAWLVTAKESLHDLDNIKLNTLPRDGKVDATYELEYILIEGHSRDTTVEAPPAGVQLALSTDKDPLYADTIIMANLGYFQFKANPGHYSMNLKAGRSRDLFKLDSVGAAGYEAQPGDETAEVTLLSFQGATLYPRLSRVPGKEEENILETEPAKKTPDFVQQGANIVGNLLNMAGIKKEKPQEARHADINIFSVASGHLYERMLNIMMVSVMRHTNQTVKFWFIEQFLSPSFKEFVPIVAKEYGFQYEMVTYKWPHWLRAQKEKQREIWGYKILFLDVLFPLDLDKVIFVDADQIVRTDMAELTAVDLQGAPYGFTPMCDSRVEMEGFRFWKQGYWKNFLGDLPYHISALYVVDLKRFRQLAAGDRLRQQYHQLSADPGSLSNLDQDLPNNMQSIIPIHSLDQNWLWCETWCSDASLEDAKTIDLCNNPLTKEPKLERARRQVPEWTEYDDEIAALARRTRDGAILTGNIQEDELFGKASPEAVSADDPKSVDDPKSADKDEL